MRYIHTYVCTCLSSQLSSCRVCAVYSGPLRVSVLCVRAWEGVRVCCVLCPQQDHRAAVRFYSQAQCYSSAIRLAKASSRLCRLHMHSTLRVCAVQEHHVIGDW